MHPEKNVFKSRYTDQRERADMRTDDIFEPFTFKICLLSIRNLFRLLINILKTVNSFLEYPVNILSGLNWKEFIDKDNGCLHSLQKVRTSSSFGPYNIHTKHAELRNQYGYVHWVIFKSVFIKPVD